jgi:hypothetical protein
MIIKKEFGPTIFGDEMGAIRMEVETEAKCTPKSTHISTARNFLANEPVPVNVTAGPITKLFAWGGEDSGGHVLRETTSRGLCGLVCPSRTSERGG